VKLPDVILLNGAPSAGKTQLALALLARLPFVCMGIDDFIWQRVPASWYMAVERFLGGPRDAGGAIEHGDEPAKLFRAFHRAVRACVAEGLGVVVDDALVRRDLLDDWVRALNGTDVFFVGVHCSEEELIFRERARRDRAPGGAVGAMKLVHAHAIYDLEIDTTTMPSSALSAEIVAALERRSGPSAFERLRSLRNP
jgi:chloramphenicol 3-O phosphotransferase